MIAPHGYRECSKPAILRTALQAGNHHVPISEPASAVTRGLEQKAADFGEEDSELYAKTKMSAR
jgi:hypothetical protein